MTALSFNCEYRLEGALSPLNFHARMMQVP
jgi:hypothetical protein